MMSTTKAAAAAFAFLASQAAFAQQATGGDDRAVAGANQPPSVQQEPDQLVEKLTRAANLLRESIQGLAQQPTGSHRTVAMERANDALQQAGGQRVPDLVEKLGLFENIRSIRLAGAG